MQAAILAVKLRHLAAWNAQRREIAGWYRETLAFLADDIELPHEASWTIEHVYHLYVVRLRRADRDVTLRRLHAAGVGAGIHYPIPIHLQEAYAVLGRGPGSFPVAEEAARCI